MRAAADCYLVTSELPCCKAFAKVTALRYLVAGHAQWMSMVSRTAYSTWTSQKPTLFDGHYLSNRSTLDIGVLGYIGIVQHKEHSPEVSHVPPGTLCICKYCSVLCNTSFFKCYLFQSKRIIIRHSLQNFRKESKMFLFVRSLKILQNMYYSAIVFFDSISCRWFISHSSFF